MFVHVCVRERGEGGGGGWKHGRQSEAATREEYETIGNLARNCTGGTIGGWMIKF